MQVRLALKSGLVSSAELLAGALLCVLLLHPVRADGSDATWSPPGIGPASVAPAAVLSDYDKLRVRGSFSERYTLRSGASSVDVTVVSTGSNYRVDANIAGAHYAMGRSGSKRWRQTPAGTVRVIESDVQSDELDRWPESVLGFDESTCAASGQTESAWVVRCHPQGDIPHWFYVSKANGNIEREVSREGSHVVTFTFGDFRPTAAGVLPYRWSISGWGGDTTVMLDGLAQSDRAVDVTMPQSTGEVFALPPGVDRVRVPAGFSADGRITVPLTINGKTLRVTLDTGTTQMLVDAGEASHMGLRPSFDHVMASDVRIGDLTAQSLPFETVDIFGGRERAIVGNEFFKGHIVHIDYGKPQVDVLDRSHFGAPTGAYEIKVNCDEGMPLVSMGIGRTIRDRVALDTGSYVLVLAQTYFTGDNPAVITRAGGRGQYMNFLEGPLLVQRGGTTSPQIGPFSLDDIPANVVIPAANSLDIPLDGIIGTQVLSHFEFWFDYDANRLWMRPTGW